MYLKSIEVYGFKSFANKILFEFHNGVTGIVGPNGSGKSNVADAVRWVLGEQRVKQLRGSNMQDVIFAGTELRKPMSYASVAITLDNSDHSLAIDFDEVTVSRRLYRSGESEYLINGTVCRLRDVQELFYDTGIGKEGYSIIGQGQIDRILSGKQEERRELFDEAAGIVKYKRRKATAQKKLDDERANLSRVKDILSEIEKHMSPLERQAEIAKVYLSKRDELKIYDINLFLVEINRIKKAISDLSEKAEISNNDLLAAKSDYEKAKEEYLSVQDKIADNESKTENIRQLYNANIIKKEQLEGELRLVNEQINSAKFNDDKYLVRIEQINDRINKLQEESDKLNSEKHEYIELAEQLKEKQQESLDVLHKQQNLIEDYTEQCETLNKEILNLLNENALEKANQERYDTITTHLEEQLENTNASIDELKAKQKDCVDRQDSLKLELSEVLDRKDSLDKDLAEFDSQLEDVREWLQSKNALLLEEQNKYYREVSKYESLHNITEYYEGYGNSVKKIMEQKNSVQGIIGVVADVIRTEKRYENAVEIALGGNIQNIITEDENTAVKMIEFLKENRHGRATFLPLTNVKPKAFEYSEALNEDGIIGLASSIVEYDKKYQKIIDYLLGTIIVAESINEAKQIAKKYKYRLKIVTLEGEFLAPGGSLTGGTFKHNNNFLGRKRELEEISARVEKFKSRVKRIEEEIAEKKDVRDDLRNKKNDILEQKQELSIGENTIHINLQKNYEDMTLIGEQITSLSIMLDKLNLESRQVMSDKSESKNKILSYDEKKNELENSLKLANEQLDKAHTTESDVLNALADLQTERHSIVQKQEFVDTNIARVMNDLISANREKDQINLEMSDISLSLKNREDYLNELQLQINTCVENDKKYSDTLRSFISEKNDYSKTNNRIFELREELSERIAALDKEAYRLSTQIERLEESRNSFINYMWDEYEITYDIAKGMYREDVPDSELKKRIKNLKNDIKALGNVNVNAIEEYKETLERYEFLKQQHDDIAKAEAALVDIINELDVGMRKQFKESFEKISIEFNKTFKELFEGGKGTLELIDDTNDVLEAGISIIAQPPGKKLQNMMQLSGGEKALTAIALLFAIQNLKPSPFCLLDEIEAALDDSNVVRFSKYLNKLTKNTQFIVITHRKGTMAAADRLYGITMQEKGISALVSVNLIEEQLDA